ncbi:hypothetical protein ACFL20_11595, partial [Spirochaetota bacterium]
IPLFSQMPGWKFYKDRDGNNYYLDRNSKIHTSGKPEFKFRPVSIEGIDFYLNHGRELIKQHHLSQGLVLLKSILAMPVKNNRIYKARVEAAKTVNYLKKREGSRFARLNESASLQVFHEKKVIHLINDQMFYSLKLPSGVVLLRKRMKKKLRHTYYGLTLGISVKDIPERTGARYDLILAMDSERYVWRFNSIDEVESNWRLVLGADNLKRKIRERGKHRKIYMFESKIKPEYSGFEGIFSNGNYVHIIRIISSKSKFKKYEKMMKRILEDFRVVK